jgi:hypothetical protein
MKRVRLHRWVLWLLPLIVARTLVPAGFMLSAGAHGVEIVPCSGFGPGFTRERHAALHGHDGHHGDHTQQQHDGGGNASAGKLCLFAIATAACTGVAWAMPATSAHLERGADSGSVVDSAEPFHPDRIRGPPLV